MATLLAAVIVTGVVAIIVPPPPAAQAQEACAGTGTATLSTPFLYPVLGQTDGDTSPPFYVTVTPRTATFTVTLNGLCAPSLGSTVTGTGTATGWCGLSTGFGTSAGHSFSWAGIGGFLVLTGGVTGVVHAVPNVLAGESCVTGADNFLVNGAGVLKPCFVASSTMSTSVTLPTTSLFTWPLSVHTGGLFHSHFSACA